MGPAAKELGALVEILVHNANKTMLTLVRPGFGEFPRST